jgi:hypothetical protein
MPNFRSIPVFECFIPGIPFGQPRAKARAIIINGKPILVTAIRDPKDLPHRELDVDIAMECTGIFTSKDKASAHLAAGAKRVLVSAPADGADITVVYGVNHQNMKKEHMVVSNASCTTNCLAPVAQVLNAAVGIDKGMMTTIHSYTNDQPSLDQMHKDLYRGRAGSDRPQLQLRTLMGAEYAARPDRAPAIASRNKCRGSAGRAGKRRGPPAAHADRRRWPARPKK